MFGPQPPPKSTGTDIQFGVNHPYEKNLKACGLKIALRKHERLHQRTIGGIFIPEEHDAAVRMCRATVVSIGSEAKDEGLKVGDVVLYDHWSVFYDTHPIVVTNVENVIVICDE